MLLPRPATLHSEDPSSSSSRSSAPAQRSILGGSSTGPAFKGTASTQATTKGPLPNNGATAFAVFKDDSPSNGDNALATQDNWHDFGTNASRKRENTRSAVPWKGETIPVYRDTPEESNALNRSRPISLSSSMKFEVFRDDDAEIPATDLGASHGNRENNGLSIAKPLRAPPEAELLRSDPFRHYAKEMVNLVEVPDLPFMQPSSNGTSGDVSKSSNKATATGTKSSSSTSSRVRSSSSSGSTLAPSEKRKERVASPLHEIYPEGANGPEYSFEELQAAKRHLRRLKTGQFGSASTAFSTEDTWKIEARNLHTSWRVDKNGQVILRDPHSGEALFIYLREQDEREQEAKLHQQQKKELAQQTEEKARREAEEAAVAEKERVRSERQKREDEEKLRIEAERRAIAQAEEIARIEAERRAFIEAEEAARIEAERLEAEKRQRELKAAERDKLRQQEEERLRREAEAEEARRLAEREEEERREAARLREWETAQRLEKEREEKAEARRRQKEEEERAIARDLFDADEERSVSPQGSAGYRPPSPTINTKAALAEVNAMFGKTMRFDGETQEDDYDSSATEQSGSSENDFDEQNGLGNDNETPFVPSQAETDGSFWSMAQSQSQQPAFSQPFSTQQSMPFDSQSSSLGFPSASESGETTEDSDGESDLAASRKSTHLDPAYYLQHSLSRSSSSSSSGISAEQQVSLQAALKSHAPAFTPFREITENDENAIPSRRQERSAFKPMRAPLGMKGSASLASASKPAFAVFTEEGESALPAAEESSQQLEDVAGYDMGRRPAGNNRFANMMDIMTPITERTCEFGMQTATMTSTLGGEMQARMLTGDQSNVEDLFDRAVPEDLASSRGSNWDAGKRLEMIDEEGDYSSQVDQPEGETSMARYC